MQIADDIKVLDAMGCIQILSSNIQGFIVVWILVEFAVVQKLDVVLIYYTYNIIVV